nr:histidinol dehydrogenase [Maliibacterium massiliense]
MSRIFDYSDPAQRQQAQARLFSRSQLQDDTVRDTVREVLANVRARGDAALIEYGARFDGVTLAPAQLRVTQQEIDAAYARMDGELLATIRRALANIQAFHAKQKQRGWMDFDGEKALGQMVRPIESVGVYVPGGRAAYPSSVLMNIVPAKVAGVARIVMATPPDKEGHAFYQSIVCAVEAGADEIYKVGGAQAIGALAYGTESIRPVDKIVGPGNIFVANAKREVYGHVGIDMIAGPSEVLIVSDDSSDPVQIAADLLSQAEHDPLAAVMLVTTSRKLAEQAEASLLAQVKNLARSAIAAQSYDNYGTIVVVDSLQQAMDIANRVAPEHLELAVRDPFALLGAVKNAGSIFLGHYAPEPLGDYFAGPNHVLPTSGTARFASALTVDDFIKKSSVLYYSKEALAACWQDVSRFARCEGLSAHARAVELRFNREEDLDA